MSIQNEIEELIKSFDTLPIEEIRRIKKSWVVLQLRRKHPELDHIEAGHYYDLYNNDLTI